GGVGDWQCTSGAACASRSDDIGYFDDLHAELARIVPIDPSRVYATGISNGAAMVYRLACERPERFAAIAPVGGANQFAAAGGSCAAGVAVLHIHGTADPCWAYGGGTAACAQKDGKRKVGVDDTLAGARVRNGCSDTCSEELLPDTADDGMTSVRVRWDGCTAAVELVRVDGGGHTWPGGWQYFSADRVGPVTRDFDADDLFVEFFDAHPKAR
ncbi:MAG: polyhydroxybutyrate depolymerase, partial [Deltaproteobacteria bacterium]